MAEHDRLEHFVFGDLLPEAFDHQDRLFAARHDQIERTLLQIGLGGKHNQPAINHADPHSGNRIVERDRCDAQGGAGAGRGMDVRIVLLVAGQDVGLDLDFAVETLGKERP